MYMTEKPISDVYDNGKLGIHRMYNIVNSVTFSEKYKKMCAFITFSKQGIA